MCWTCALSSRLLERELALAASGVDPDDVGEVGPAVGAGAAPTAFAGAADRVGGIGGDGAGEAPPDLEPGAFGRGGRLGELDDRPQPERGGSWNPGKSEDALDGDCWASLLLLPLDA